MYKLYKRVPKTKDFMYGVKPIEESENPFLEGPCLLCISGQYDNSLAKKSNFGVVKEGMKMARLRVRGQKNAGFDVKDFPVSFLAIELDKKDEERSMTQEERITEFVTKYFVPLVSVDGKRIDCTKAMKNMRNVNIMSYCNGTKLTQQIEGILIKKMYELGYTEEEITMIQSQMCMFPIATDRLRGKQKSTCISFKDIEDEEVNENVTEEEEKEVSSSSIEEELFEYSDTESSYLYRGDGFHSFKKYTEEERAMTVCLSSAISKALENSVENSKGEDFIPISAKKLTSNFKSIMKRFSEKAKISELMTELDKNLTYGGARRLSEYEEELLDQMDEMFDMQIKTKKELEAVNIENDKNKKTIQKNDEAMDMYCTETTRDKILLYRGWQFSDKQKKDIQEASSDKEIIEEMPKNSQITVNKAVTNALSSQVTSEQVEAAKNVENTEQSKQNEENIEDGLENNT